MPLSDILLAFQVDEPGNPEIFVVVDLLPVRSCHAIPVPET